MDFWTNPSLLVPLAVVVILAVALLQGRRGRRPGPAEEADRARADSAPRCVCGEPATDPSPILKRDRGAWDWLRNYFGAPPRYRREIDGMRPPAFCRSHAHVADEMLLQWVFETRAKYSALHVEVASGAAGFEQEHLLAKVQASLTEKQKRAVAKQLAPRVVSIARATGTEDGDAGSAGSGG